jgi:hypothetical protein
MPNEKFLIENPPVIDSFRIRIKVQQIDIPVFPEKPDKIHGPHASTDVFRERI